MKRKGNVMSRLTPELVHQAVINASRKHMCKNEVIEFLQDKENEYSVYRQLLKGESIDVEYRYKEVVSVNGKKRIVAISSFRSRVIMHTLMLLIKKEYAARLSDDCYNCIKGRGINASRKRYDPVRQIKRIIGRYRPWGYLQLDIRKCYESTRPEVLFACHEAIWKDKRILRYLQRVSFCDIGLPIGTPSSPMNQHIMMMAFDRFIRQDLKIRHYVRYADDIILFGDKDKLHEAKWRIANYLWYNLGYELKKDAHPTPMRNGTDILGYVFHCGYTRVRKSIKERMKRSWRNPRSRSSYLGILKGADAKNLKRKLNMKLSFLITNETKVRRRMDSPLIDIAELTGKVFDILDFEVREPDKKKGKAWMRMQVRYEDMGDDGKPVVKTRLVKGFHVAICEFLKNMTQYINKTSAISGMSYEETFKKTLPFEDCEVENRNGWCIKGTLEIEE